MSNYLAIATVTAALQQRLIQAIANAGVANASVTTERPDKREKDTDPGVNVFLYQTAPNPSFRNADLPAFRGNGEMVQRPRAALDLHYLITCYGDENLLQPQRLMGAVVSNLHAEPLLTPQEIVANVVSPSSPPPVTDPRHFLATSDLADEVERVRFTPLPLTTEELSKLWSVLFQTPYSLSTAYGATVVFVEQDKGTPRPALPVRDRNVYVVPFLAPRVERIVSGIDPELPIQIGGPIVIEGQDLRGDVTRVLLAGAEVTPAPLDVGGDRIELALPGSLAAGVVGLQVLHRMMMGTPPALHRGLESNVAAFVLTPRIQSIAFTPPVPSAPPFNTNITLQVEPLLREGQRTALLLNHAAGGRAHRFELAPLGADTNSVTFPASGLESGPYYVRLQVDGAESTLLDVNPLSPTFKQFINPQLTIP